MNDKELCWKCGGDGWTEEPDCSHCDDCEYHTACEDKWKKVKCDICGNKGNDYEPVMS